jgi:hypothetical protein
MFAGPVEACLVPEANPDPILENAPQPSRSLRHPRDPGEKQGVRSCCIADLQLPKRGRVTRAEEDGCSRRTLHRRQFELASISSPGALRKQRV